MKKILIFFMIMLGILSITGCGNNDKKEAERLNEEYYVVVKQTYDECMKGNPEIKTPDEMLVEINRLSEEKYLPTINEVKTKLEREQVNKSISIIKSDLVNLTNSVDDFVKYMPKAVQGAKNRQKGTFLKLIKMATTVEENILVYQNDYSKITTGKGTYELTFENYTKILPNTSYMDIIKIFKMPGKLVDSSYLYNTLIENYIWEINGAKVKMTFNNTILESMEQEGLN